MKNIFLFAQVVTVTLFLFFIQPVTAQRRMPKVRPLLVCYGVSDPVYSVDTQRIVLQVVVGTLARLDSCLVTDKTADFAKQMPAINPDSFDTTQLIKLAKSWNASFVAVIRIQKNQRSIVRPQGILQLCIIDANSGLLLRKNSAILRSDWSSESARLVERLLNGVSALSLIEDLADADSLYMGLQKAIKLRTASYSKNIQLLQLKKHELIQQDSVFKTSMQQILARRRKKEMIVRRVDSTNTALRMKDNEAAMSKMDTVIGFNEQLLTLSDIISKSPTFAAFFQNGGDDALTSLLNAMDIIDTESVDEKFNKQYQYSSKFPPMSTQKVVRMLNDYKDAIDASDE